MKITKKVRKWLKQFNMPPLPGNTVATELEIEQEVIIRGPDGKIKKKIKTSS